MRSPFLPAATSIAALIASLVRWWLQDSGNLYTAVEKRFYLPDPDLGWRVSAAHPVWLGLDLCAVIAALAIALAIGGWVIRRRESPSRGLRAVAWMLGAVLSSTSDLEVRPLTRLFRALGDETRLRIVALLSHGELCVCHIESALDLHQSTASRQLGILKTSGVVDSRRDGTWVYYRLTTQEHETVASALEVLTKAGPRRRAATSAVSRQ